MWFLCILFNRFSFCDPKQIIRHRGIDWTWGEGPETRNAGGTLDKWTSTPFRMSYLDFTVEPSLRGQHRNQEKCSLNRGIPLIRVIIRKII